MLDNKFMIPLSSIGEILGAYTDYDEKTNTVQITPNAANLITYTADGFSIKVPINWKKVYSTLSSDKRTETYYLYEIEGINIRLSITDMTEDPYITSNPVYNAKLLYGSVLTPTEIKFKDADKAYVFDDCSEDLTVKSRKGLVIFKNNYCYIYRFTQPAADMTLTGYLIQYANESQYVRNLFDETMTTFELTKDNVNLTSNITSQEFFDKTREIKRDGKTAIDEDGTIIQLNDNVSCGGFYGTVVEIKNSQVLVEWTSKSVVIGNSKSDIQYWSNISGVNYLTQQWMDSIDIKVVQ
jgi:hypothetical protein